MHSAMMDAWSLSKAKGNTSFAIMVREGKILSSPINTISQMFTHFHFELSTKPKLLFRPFRRLLTINGFTSSTNNVCHKLSGARSDS